MLLGSSWCRECEIVAYSTVADQGAERTGPETRPGYKPSWPLPNDPPLPASQDTRPPVTVYHLGFNPIKMWFTLHTQTMAATHGLWWCAPTLVHTWERKRGRMVCVAMQVPLFSSSPVHSSAPFHSVPSTWPCWSPSCFRNAIPFPVLNILGYSVPYLISFTPAQRSPFPTDFPEHNHPA